MKKYGRAITCIMAIAALATLLLASPAVASGPTPDFPVHLLCGDAYWASYGDYTQRLLTVDYDIGNGGSVPAYNVTIQSASANNEVTGATTIPIWLGDMDPGIWDTAVFKWVVPVGVQSFRTDLSICSSCDPTICVGEETDDGGINIKTGSCPNSIKLNGNGNVAVGVYTYGQFDSRTLDPDTVIFHGAAPVSWGAEDINSDGELDMVFHFDKADMNLQAGDFRGCLSADIIGGGSFRSCDMIRIV